MERTETGRFNDVHELIAFQGIALQGGRALTPEKIDKSMLRYGMYCNRVKGGC